MTDRRRYEIAGDPIPRRLAVKARREAEEQKSLWEQVEELRQRLKAEQEARAELESRFDAISKRVDYLEMKIKDLAEGGSAATSPIPATIEHRVDSIEPDLKELEERFKGDMRRIDTRLDTLIERSDRMIGRRDERISNLRANFGGRILTVEQALRDMEDRLRKLEERGTQVGVEPSPFDVCLLCSGGGYSSAGVGPNGIWTEKCPRCQGTGRA